MVYLTYTSIGRQDLHLLRRVNAKHLRSPVFKRSGYSTALFGWVPTAERPPRLSHLRSSLGATQSSNLADMTGLEPVTNGLTVRYSTN